MRKVFLFVLLFTKAASVLAGSLQGIYVGEGVQQGDNWVYTLTAVPEVGERFRGFQAEFFGEMKQQFAFDTPTPFKDFDPFLPNLGLDDSKFLFHSGDVLSFGVEETSESLVGAISALPDGTTEFARIVVPRNGVVFYRILLDFGTSEALEVEGFHFGGNIFPEPTTAFLAAFAALAIAYRRR